MLRSLNIALSFLLVSFFGCSAGSDSPSSAKGGINGEKYLTSVWQEESLDYSKIKSVLLSSFNNVAFDSLDGELKIPTIIHRVWVTNPNAPRELPEKDLVKLEQNINLFKSSKFSWGFKLWINVEPEKIPMTQKRCAELGVEIISIDTLDTDLKPALDNLILKKRYVAASDTIRIEAIRTLGGIYVDNDYTFYNLVDKYVTNYDSVFGVHLVEPAILGNAFLAASPGHPIMKHAHELLLRNLLGLGISPVPHYISCPGSRMTQILMSTGPWMLTIAAQAAINQNGMRDLILPYGTIFMWPNLKDNPKVLLQVYNKSKMPHCIDDKTGFLVPGNCSAPKWIDVIGNDDYQGSWSSGLVEDPIEACPVPLLGV